MFEDLPLTMARARAIWDEMDKNRQVPAPALHPRTVSVPREEAQVNSSVDSSISFSRTFLAVNCIANQSSGTLSTAKADIILCT